MLKFPKFLAHTDLIVSEENIKKCKMFYLIADNPFNEFHVNAKYINSSAVAAEVFHVANRVKVTDAMLALRLNTSHLLHSRIHWRPTALAELKVNTPDIPYPPCQTRHARQHYLGEEMLGYSSSYSKTYQRHIFG